MESGPHWTAPSQLDVMGAGSSTPPTILSSSWPRPLPRNHGYNSVRLWPLLSPRTPMLLALVGNDLQQSTEGRFVLGLGSQVRPHVERRFSMPWEKPLARMREMIQAIHAIWDSWETGGRLNHQGEYYTHTLMTPVFDPGPNPYGRPPIFLGVLGPGMTELAGEVADGIVIHRLMSQRFLDEVTLPSIQRGMARRTRQPSRPFEVVYPPFVAAASTPTVLAEQIAEIRSQIAFYASTPSYRSVLELHGWTDIGNKLSALSCSGDWQQMANVVTDKMVEELAVISESGQVESDLEKRFGGLVDRIVLYPPL